MQHRVLIVDDDFAIRGMLAVAFERNDIQADVAEGGLQATDLLQRNRGEYCSVLLDLSIPPPSGIEVARFIGERMPDIAVVVITGRSDLADRLRAQPDVARVVKAIMIKPVDLQSLVALVHSACPKAPADAAAERPSMA